MKKTFKVIKNLSMSMSWRMFSALFSKPLLLFPTIFGTIESVLYSEVNFQESHSGQGVANAFRHAAWNLLIAKNCSFITTNQKAIEWSKFITDLHEECFPNEAFDRAMDLHNNKIGRDVFRALIENGVNSKRKMINYLIEKTKTAVGLDDEKKFSNHTDEMVYLKKSSEN